MSTASAYDTNLEVARRINEEALRDPQSPYAGKFVGINLGQVVTVGDDLDEVVDRLEELNSIPLETFCFKAGVDYSKVHEIWGLAT